jgi:hypothetical protein
MLSELFSVDELAKVRAKIIWKDGSPVCITCKQSGEKILNVLNCAWDTDNSDDGKGGNVFTEYIGNDVAHNNVQPVLAVYAWRRQA